MTGTEATEVGPGTGTYRPMTAQEAAEELGMNERTIRKWLAKGRLQGEYDGRSWTVYLPDDGPGRRAGRSGQGGPEAGTGPGRAGKGPEHAELIAALEKIQHENVQLAARCGYLQARLEAAERQVLALSAPAETREGGDRAPWWRRLLGMEPA
jgi:excisionase family DNA binding protein